MQVVTILEAHTRPAGRRRQGTRDLYFGERRREVACCVAHCRSVAVQPWSYGTRSYTVVRRSNAWNVKTTIVIPHEPSASRGVSLSRTRASRARGAHGGAVLSVGCGALAVLSSRHWGLGRGGPDDVARRTKPHESHDTLATTLCQSGGARGREAEGGVVCGRCAPGVRTRLVERQRGNIHTIYEREY